MGHIIDAYCTLGMPQEAQALKAVVQADADLMGDGGDLDRNPHDILGQAYHSVPGHRDEEEERWAAILQFVRSHPAAFGVPSTQA